MPIQSQTPVAKQNVKKLLVLPAALNPQHPLYVGFTPKQR